MRPACSFMRPACSLMRQAPATALLALALACLAPAVAGAGVFELQILEFSSAALRLRSGACCGGAVLPSCSHPCRARFSLCLKEYQSAAAPGACSFGRAASPVLGTDSFTLAEPFYTLSLPFTFRWTRSFTLILQAYDDYDYRDTDETGLMEEAWWSGIVEPGAAWHLLRHAGAAASLAYRVRVTCQPNYYNSTCTTFCRPRDDKFGHYSCSELGEKSCLPGWQGDNCERPVCKEGCHPTHGRCDLPGECLCRPGWRGDLCSQCQPYPGCKHGYCNGSSWDCTCDTNWGGILCDQDLNYCGTHEPCQHGGTCENTAPDQYLCTCAEGFSGTNCERVDNPCAPQPCAHGACSLNTAPPGFTCACQPGWGGALCDHDIDDCASAPCRNGASCRDRVDAFACDCAPGWTGSTCEDDVDECAAEPCVNAAACNNTAGGYSCACVAGFTGRDCETNVDDCTGQCLNGATCIDLVNDFHCACAAGFEGRTCALDVDECLSRPCRHGGECVDLRNAYRCICPVGFSGTDCELAPCSGRYCPDDRDHCAGAPCGNGAACYTAQSDYYCHCAPGWAGKNCTLRATIQLEVCSVNPCQNNGSCVPGPADFTCVCPSGWTGKTCGSRVECAGGCGSHGSCVRGAEGWACACRGGWGGARCHLPPDACASAPCRNGARCSGGPDWWACECAPGWGGPDCALPAPAPAPSPSAPPAAPGCAPACPPPAVCARGRCLCPASPPRVAVRCLEQLAGVGTESGEAESTEMARVEAGAGAECAGGGWWWWGCNACRCGASAPACTRLWCGLPDCLAPDALPCRADEVCVPAAPALCLRAPCQPLGECRRVAGRHVEPPALPAPASCWPGTPSAALPPAGCARARLQLERARLAPGAHVERACGALRRAVSAALAHQAPPAPPLTLLCDLAPDDDDALDLALWVGDDDSGSESGADTLGLAVRALSELVSRGRGSQQALLRAALRLHVPPARPAAAPHVSHAPTAALLAGGAVALLLAAAAAFFFVRRRRAAAAAEERSRRCDEEKSNNLQNEENLRRYANPLRGEAAGAALYKAQNADARNTAVAAPRDKELSMRALPPGPPPRAPPERLTVLV